MNFVSDNAELSISPNPEVVSFCLDVGDDGKSDGFNSDSGLFFELVDGDAHLLPDLFSLVFNFDIHIILELDDDGVSFHSDSLGLNADCKAPFGLKIGDDLDVVIVNTINLDCVVGFKIFYLINVDNHAFFFFISEELSVVDGDSFDLDFEVKLKGKFKFKDDFFMINFDLLEINLSFSRDFRFKFCNTNDSLLFNLYGLNNDPFSPVNPNSLEFDMGFSDDFLFSDCDLVLPCDS